MFDITHDILLIDDDIDILEAYQDLLMQEGYRVIAIAEPLGIIDKIPPHWPGIILCDVLLPGLSGLNLLTQFRQKDPALPILMITGHGDVPMAVEAVKNGAFDFMEKPIEPNKLLHKVQMALTQRRTFIKKWQRQIRTLNEKIIGRSEWVQALKETIQTLSSVDIPVYLWGEVGTGRQLVASCLHDLSEKQHHALIIHECSPNQSNQLAELIDKVGQGVLVLKNIHYLTPADQLLLANVQQNESRLCRLIVISGQPLSVHISQQQIIPELYYLFSLTQIGLLPLSERRNDIADIFTYYIKQASVRLDKEVPPLKTTFLKRLMQREWIGNVRELINLAELYVIGLVTSTEKEKVIKFSQVDKLPLDQRVSEYEKQLIEEALNFYEGRINDVAYYLNIPRKKLYLRMKKHGLDKKFFRLS